MSDKRIQKLKKKQGFTLVELSLSIVFIAILSITIALIINDAISTYRRGLTLNQINTVGMDLVDDMRAAIQNSPAKDVAELCDDIYKEGGGVNAFDIANQKKACKEDKGQKFVNIVKFSTNANKVKVKGNDTVGAPIFGAFCTGAYSYIWNSGYLFTEDNSSVGKASISYNYNGVSGSLTDFRLVKVRDDNRSVCRSALEEGKYVESYMGTNMNVFTVGKTNEEPMILLGGDDSNNNSTGLALYELSAPAPAANGVNAAFYAVSFILGTVQGGIDVMSSGNFCSTPGEYESNFDYCAINKFNFAAQANGG